MTPLPAQGQRDLAATQQSPAVLPGAFGHDVVLYAAVLGLVGFGLVMVYSASAVYAKQKFGAAEPSTSSAAMATGTAPHACSSASVPSTAEPA